MSSASIDPLEQLLRLNSSSLNFNDRVCNILYGAGYSQWVEGVNGDDVARLIDFLDTALDALEAASPGFRRCLRELREICGARKILPTSYTPLSQALTIGRQPVASGGSGDVYEGTLDGSEVCVKRVRVYNRDGPEAAIKTFYREAVMWKCLDHKNIVPLLGITTNPPQLISEWMSGGHLTKYIGKYPEANRLGLVCDIAEGLYHIHSRNIVHGDLKGQNIVVDDTGRARITDFGLSTVPCDLDWIPDNHGHTTRWTAPEILKEDASHSKEADVFSFAMVMIEAFTGDVPFNGSPPAAAILFIIKGTRPPRPTHTEFTRGLWTLMQRCWNADPHLRPEVSEILKALGITIFLPPKPSIYNMDYGSSLSVEGLGYSIEIPAVITPPDATDLNEFVPSFNASSLPLAEINSESQDHLAQEFIDRLDMTLGDLRCDQERHELLNILCKICSRQRMLPKAMHVGRLSGQLVEEYHGGRAVIFRAQRNNHQVAIKIMRVTMCSDFDKCRSEFCREAVAWRHLRHPNILPLLGVDLKQHQLSMVSEWMDEGNINEYVEQHGGVNRLQLLVEAATGLEYMHGLNMVHGDLKGANILIKSHRACLADFGLSTVVSVEHNIAANASLITVASKASLMSFTAGGTPRWMSPELLDPEGFGASDDRPTKKSDCYALGMVVYEVLSRNSPYWDITNEGLLMYFIIEGYRPKKPDAAESLGFTNELWKTIQQCWLAEASARPDVRTILSHLNYATWSWERRRLA